VDKTIYDHPLYFKRKGILKNSLLLFFVISCHQQEEVRILFTGDILLSRQVKREYDYRKTSCWEDFKPLFKKADLVVGNLEGAVGIVSDTVNLDGSPLFAIDSADIFLLADAGFNMIGIENNHNYDLGDAGRQNTIHQLLQNQIHPVYYENSPYFITVKNRVLSIITINMVPGRNDFVNPVYSLELQQKLRLSKSISHIVIVSIHWGSELLEWSNRVQREAAKWLIAHGADVIIGSHPHVVQNPEIIEGKPCFFSLGNHLFDQKYPATQKGLIVEITIKNGKFKCRGITTRTKKNSYYPEIAETVSYPFPDVSCSDKLLNINDYTIIPASVFDENKPGIVLEGYRDNRLQWRSRPLPLVYLAAAKFDEKEAYLFALQRNYSTLDKETALRPYVYAIDFHGIYAKWRGTALSYPLADASISPDNPQIVCALHRSDSYIALDKMNPDRHVMAYEWNGFGFRGLPDSVACRYCESLW
jgi:poly-gamma-glutamate synthesis protein (capsule biosynthesis protein)